MDIKAQFGLVLRQRRTSRELTQQALADASGLSLRYIQELEAGDKQPTLGTAFDIALGLDMTPQQLVAAVWKTVEG